MTYPVLSRAPIVEAFLDIRVEPELSDLGVLGAFELGAKDEFPVRNEVVEWSGRLELNPSAGPQLTFPSQVVRGFSYTAEDKRRVLQARTNGFSMSHLQPYRNWAALREDARGWWARYVAHTHPQRVTRIGLRFINRLPLPTGVDAKRFVLTTVEIAPDLPQTLHSMFMRVVIPFGNTLSIVTQLVDDAGVTDELVPLILDIDVFRTVSLTPDDEALWQGFDDLRDVKNQVFFKSLTPAAIEMFK